MLSMAGETGKALARRLGDSRFLREWFVGDGIDIGAGNDRLELYLEYFPLMTSCLSWDKENGNGETVETIKNNSMNFVYSSHCLEHITDPYKALQNWIRITKLGGHLILAVPDEDLYEQGVFPSTFNKDHKWTFTVMKKTSWSRASINILEMVQAFADQTQCVKVELIDGMYRRNLVRFDRTIEGHVETCIEIVLRKVGSGSTEEGLLLREPAVEVRKYLNQMILDRKISRQYINIVKPFEDTGKMERG